jgi:hypothetical protein
MEALREANDGLIAENQSLREELELSRLQYNRLLNDHNKCLRRASELQVANQDLGKRLAAVNKCERNPLPSGRGQANRGSYDTSH